MIHTIDATNKAPGRVASEAAKILMGKQEATYQRHTAPTAKVVIINASKAKISEKKKINTTFERYSGHPGGFRSDSMAKVIAKKGYAEIFQNAVFGMIPRNRLHTDIMKNLTVTE